MTTHTQRSSNDGAQAEVKEGSTESEVCTTELLGGSLDIKHHEDSPPRSKARTSFDVLCAYFRKFLGVSGKASPARSSVLHTLASCVLAFIGIFIIAITDHWFLNLQFKTDNHAVAMLTGAQAASAGITSLHNIT
jgi:hypothetical protein